MGMFTGKIKVVRVDLLCFPVDPETLEPLACGVYDPWAFTDPDDDGSIEVISDAEYKQRCQEKWRKENRRTL